MQYVWFHLIFIFSFFFQFSYDLIFSHFASKPVSYLDDEFHEKCRLFIIFQCESNLSNIYLFNGSYHMVARSRLPIPAHFIGRMPFWISEYDFYFIFSFLFTFKILTKCNEIPKFQMFTFESIFKFETVFGGCCSLILVPFGLGFFIDRYLLIDKLFSCPLRLLLF